MNRIKLWPHATIVLVVVALVAGLGVYLWMNHEQTASAETLPYAARIQRVDGEVAFSDSRAGADGSQDWTAATANQPFSEGDRIYTRHNARTSLAITDAISRGSIRTSSLDCASIDDRRTQPRAPRRLGHVRCRVLANLTVETFEGSYAQRRNQLLISPGFYNVSFDWKWRRARFGFERTYERCRSRRLEPDQQGEMLTLLSQAASEVAPSR